MKRKIKPLIYVFCEGESEIEYVNFLKERCSCDSKTGKRIIFYCR